MLGLCRFVEMVVGGMLAVEGNNKHSGCKANDYTQT